MELKGIDKEVKRVFPPAVRQELLNGEEASGLNNMRKQ